MGRLFDRYLEEKRQRLHLQSRAPHSIVPMSRGTYVIAPDGSYRKLKGKELEAVHHILETPREKLLQELNAKQ